MKEHGVPLFHNWLPFELLIQHSSLHEQIVQISMYGSGFTFVFIQPRIFCPASSVPIVLYIFHLEPYYGEIPL